MLSTSMVLPQAADLKLSVTNICGLGSSDPTKETSKKLAQAQGRHQFDRVSHRGLNGAKVKAKVRVKVPNRTLV